MLNPTDSKHTIEAGLTASTREVFEAIFPVIKSAPKQCTQDSYLLNCSRKEIFFRECRLNNVSSTNLF